VALDFQTVMPSYFSFRLMVFLTAFAFGLAPTLILDRGTDIQGREIAKETTREFSPLPLERSNCVSEKFIEGDHDSIGRAVAHTEKYAMLMEKRYRIGRKHAERPTSKTETELLKIDLELSEVVLAIRRVYEAELNGNRETLLHREICLEP
jgi:hypothetical protein